MPSGVKEASSELSCLWALNRLQLSVWKATDADSTALSSRILPAPALGSLESLLCPCGLV